MSQSEGNGGPGTTAFNFTVSLSVPAQTGGVSFTVNTANGTADGSDYVTITNGAGSIPEGSSSTQVTVQVNGDVAPEANETFFVNISNVTGAGVTDSQGQGTIQNDDAACANLSINDVTQIEGDAGTSTFAFTVSLSQAGCGTVTFDIATADGTAQDDNPATEDSDYVPQSLTGQTITSPSTYTFNVTVNGDLTGEPDQTFFVNISNVSPANVQVTDAQGLGTITNDDYTRIHDIQGNGNSSPIVGTSVTTRGIVTGRKTNGYFIQEPDASVDADPNTSEAIFVFTSSAPSASITVGDLVSVTGTVAEFEPASTEDPDGVTPTADPKTATELTSPTTTFLSSANPLPAPLTEAIFDSAALSRGAELEKYEYMRVSVSSITVGQPTNGFGEFWGVVTGVARPFREPGIEKGDPIPLADEGPHTGSAPPNVPIFDGNFERIMVDSDDATSTANVRRSSIFVTTSAVVTNIVGPLDFVHVNGTGHYRIMLDFTPTPTPVVTPGFTAAIPAPTPTAAEFTISHTNLENFSSSNATKLSKASLAIRNVLKTPDVVGLIEVDTTASATALANKINTDFGNLAAVNYVAYFNDIAGNTQDIGYLVNTARVSVSGSATPYHQGNTFTYCGVANQTLHDRPSLILNVNVPQPVGGPLPVTVILNHTKSLIAVDSPVSYGTCGTGTEGGRNREKRRLQAEDIADLIELHIAENLVVLGDLNAFDFNDGLQDMVGTLKGAPAPANQVVEPSTDDWTYTLTNLINTLPADQRYSFAFEGNAQALDHVLVNSLMLQRNTRYAYGRYNGDFSNDFASNSGTPERVADHDAPVAYFAFSSANVSITKTLDTSGPYFAGGTVSYTLNVANAGPDTANNIQVTDTPTNLTITNVSGSGCSALPCTITSLAAAANTNITVTATIDAPGAFDNSATATGDEFDSNTSNNTDSTGNGGSTAPLPTLNINDVAQVEGNAGTSTFDFTVSLTSAAGPGGVSFTVNTADGSADGSDYLAITNGAGSISEGNTSTTVSVTVNGDTTPEPNETFSVNLSSITGATPGDVQGLGTILNDDEAASAGQVIISEFRFRGPGSGPPVGPVSDKVMRPGTSGSSSKIMVGSGAADEFIEMYNNTDSDITVSTTDGSAGWALVASTGNELCRIDNGTVLPARGHYLCTNAGGYSLNAYAFGDTAWIGVDIPDGGGVALFRTNNPGNYTLARRLDAAGYVGVDDLYREGAGFPTGGAEMITDLDYTFFRTMTRTTGGLPKDTGDNVADFKGVSTNGAATGQGNQLGAPGPENLSSPINRNALFSQALLDPSQPAGSSPNRDRNFVTEPNADYGTMTIRRTFTNNTGQTLTRLRFRIVEITTLPPAGSGIADLRALDSLDEPIVTTGGPVLVHGTLVEQPPSQAMGGGWNASLNVPYVSGGVIAANPVSKVLFESPKKGTILLNVPLNNGESINIQFKLGVMQTGFFVFYLNVEAGTGCTEIALAPCSITQPVTK